MHESHPQFVLLRHERGDAIHWDLGLDMGGALATWQILENPEKLAEANLPLAARRLGAHRRAYLDYEGPISGNRGHVTRVDRGPWQLVEQRADLWRFRLEGRVLYGAFSLERTSEVPEEWSIRRER
jgi:hypothetical protein